MTNSKNFFRKLYKIPSPTLNTGARKNIRLLNQYLSAFSKPVLLNLGSGQRFLGEKILKEDQRTKILNLDMSRFATVDVLGDAHHLPFSQDVFHGVICQALLEHVYNPEHVVSEIFRVLKNDGFVYAEIPFLQGYHPTPHDYYRFTGEGIISLFSRFARVDSGVCVGPSSTLSWILREYLTGLLTGFSEKKKLRGVAGFMTGWLTFPIKYLDFIFSKGAGAHRIASGFYFLGKKTDKAISSDQRKGV